MEVLFSGHGWKVTLDEAPLPDGRVKKAARVQRADSVHLLAFPEEGKVLLLREFRPFYCDWIWMLPSGRADKESDLHEAAQRELQEETGCRAGRLVPFGTAHHSESFVMANHFFLAYDLMSSSLPQDEDELIEVHTLPVEEALERVLSSSRVHLPSAYGLLRCLRAAPTEGCCS